MAGRSDIEAGRAHVSMYVKGRAQILNFLNDLGSQSRKAGKVIMGIGGAAMAAGSAIIGGIAGAVTKFTAMGTELDRVSKRSGVAASSLAEMKYAAESVGGSLGDVESTLANMRSKFLDPKQFDVYASAIAAIENPSLRAARAQDIFGSAGAKLLPMLGQMKKLRQEAQDLGIVPTDQAVADAAEIGKAFGSLKSAALASIFEIGAAIAPVLKPGLEMLKNIAGTTNRWIRENAGVVRTVLAIGVGLVAAGAAVTAIGAVLFALGSAGTIAATAIGAIGSLFAFMVSPLGIVLGLVLGVGVGLFAWMRYTDSGKAAFASLLSFALPLLETLKTTVGGVFDALKAGDLLLAGKIALKGLQILFFDVFASISEGIGGQLGDTLGTIGTKILGGDFAGAFQTAFKQILAWGASFAEGLVAIFTMAARMATDAWQGAVGRISDYLLDTAAGGGVGGALVSKVLGVDVGAEAARTEQLNAQLRAQGAADVGDGFVNDAKAAAREQIGGMADAFRDILDGIDGTMQDFTRDAENGLKDDTAGGSSKLREQVERLRAELEELRKQAADAAAGAAAKGKAATNDVGGILGASRLENFASFSAAAFQAGAGTGLQGRIAAAVEKQVEKSDQMLKKMDETKTAISTLKLGFVA